MFAVRCVVRGQGVGLVRWLSSTTSSAGAAFSTAAGAGSSSSSSKSSSKSSSSGSGSGSGGGITKVDEGLYEVDEEVFHELMHAPDGEFTLGTEVMGAESEGLDKGQGAAFAAALIAAHEAEAGSGGDTGAGRGVAVVTTRETHGPGPETLYGGAGSSDRCAPGDAKVVLTTHPKAAWGLDEVGVYELGVIAGPRYNAAKDVLTLTVDATKSMQANRATALEQLDALFAEVARGSAANAGAPSEAILAASQGFALADDPELGVESVSNVEDHELWLSSHGINTNLGSSTGQPDTDA